MIGATLVGMILSTMLDGIVEYTGSYRKCGRDVRSGERVNFEVGGAETRARAGGHEADGLRKRKRFTHISAIASSSSGSKSSAGFAFILAASQYMTGQRGWLRTARWAIRPLLVPPAALGPST